MKKSRLARIVTPAILMAAVRKGLRAARTGRFDHPALPPPRGAPVRAGSPSSRESGKLPKPGESQDFGKSAESAQAHRAAKLRNRDDNEVSGEERAAAEAATHRKPVPTQTAGNSGVSSPLELGLSAWRATIGRTAREVSNDHITLTAAGLAFYWFLSVFPSLVAAIAMLDLLHADPSIISGVRRVIGIALPDEAAKLLSVAIANLAEEPRKASALASIIGLGLAMWSASSGMVAMQIGLDVAYDVRRQRSFLRKRLLALVLVVAAMLFGGFSVSLIVFGQPIGRWLGRSLPEGALFATVWTAGRWIVALALLTLLIALFYYLGPNRESPNWRWITPGGLLAMVLWVAASLGFSAYVRSFGTYGRTYGSLAGVVILILWLYLAGLAMLLGAELNAELERQSAVRAGASGTPG